MHKHQRNSGNGASGLIAFVVLILIGIICVSGIPGALRDYFAHQTATTEYNVTPDQVATDCPQYFRGNRENWYLAWCDRYAFLVPESGKFDAAKAERAVIRWRDANFDRFENCGKYVVADKSKRAGMRNDKANPRGWCEAYLDKFPGKANYDSARYNSWLDANRRHACFDADEDMNRAGEKGCREAVRNGDVEVWSAGL